MLKGEKGDVTLRQETGTTLLRVVNLIIQWRAYYEAQPLSLARAQARFSKQNTPVCSNTMQASDSTLRTRSRSMVSASWPCVTSGQKH